MSKFLTDVSDGLSAWAAQPNPVVGGHITIGDVTFNSTDVSLLLLCPVCAALGVIVSLVLKGHSGQSKVDGIKRFFTFLITGIGNLFIGLVLGLVVALFFVGAINEEVTSLTRVLALSVLLGFQSRHLWFAQEAVIKKLVDQKVREIVGSGDKA